VHEEVDRKQGSGAVEIVAKLARTDEEQQRVRDVVRNTLELLWRFFEALAATPAESDNWKSGIGVQSSRNAARGRSIRHSYQTRPGTNGDRVSTGAATGRSVAGAMPPQLKPRVLAYEPIPHWATGGTGVTAWTAD